jgi:hypothetical protein
MGLIGWILLGELALVALVGAVVAFMVAKFRENRLISALGEIAQGLRASEFERREEMQFLCSELFRLSASDTRMLVDDLLDAEKRHLSVLARILLERDMDALSHFQEQLAELTVVQLKTTGEAIRQAQTTGDFPPHHDLPIAEPAVENPDVFAGHDDVENQTSETTEAIDPDDDTPGAETLDDEAESSPEGETETDRPSPPSLLSPEEIEREIWGELEQIESTATVAEVASDMEARVAETSGADRIGESPDQYGGEASDIESAAMMEDDRAPPENEGDPVASESAVAVELPDAEALPPIAEQMPTDEADLAVSEPEEPNAPVDSMPAEDRTEAPEPPPTSDEPSDEDFSDALASPVEAAVEEPENRSTSRRKRRKRKRSTPGGHQKAKTEAADDAGDDG